MVGIEAVPPNAARLVGDETNVDGSDERDCQHRAENHRTQGLSI